MQKSPMMARSASALLLFALAAPVTALATHRIASVHTRAAPKLRRSSPPCCSLDTAIDRALEDDTRWATRPERWTESDALEECSIGRLDKCGELLAMARPHNIPSSIGLVLFGAYSVERSYAFFARPPVAAQVALSILLTVIVTTTSCIINDYFDYTRGVDTELNNADRPLVAQRISPTAVKRMLKWAYAVHIGLLCLVSSAPLRLYVYANTMLTYAYTKHIKPVTFLKNAICASVVAMAVGFGAVASAGAFTVGMAAAWPYMLTLFCGFCHRELLMDIGDTVSDAAAGVRTLPVLLGRRNALLVSIAPLAVAAVAAAACVPAGPHVVGGRLLRAAAAAPFAVMAHLAWRVRRRAYAPKALSAAIEFAPAFLLASMLATLALTSPYP